nr:Mu-like prophage major head subunit gpT family protein [uncultured Shinella sp.]
MIINKSNLSLLNTGYKTAFRGAFSAVAPSYQRVATVIASTTLIETYGWMKDLSGMREWVGERFVKNLGDEAYQLRNKKYEETVAVPRTAIEDDQYGTYSTAIAMMGENAANLPEELIYLETLPNGFTSKCYDGQYFFDTDHPVMDKDGVEYSVSNRQAGSSDPWFLLSTNRTLKPLIYQERSKPELIIKDDPETSDDVFNRDEFRYGTRARGAGGYGFWQFGFGSEAELTMTNFKSARTSMQKVKRDGGKPGGIVPNLLVVGPSNEDRADEIINVQRLANGQDNPMFKKVEVLVVPWLP